MKNVMVVIDESYSSYELLFWVLENLIDSIKTSKVFIFASQPKISFTPRVLPSPLGCAQMFFPFSANAELTWLAQEKSKIISLELLKKAKKICADYGIKAETFTETGDPKDVICRAVKKHNIDSLIISDKQNKKLSSCFMGGLSGYCLKKKTKCSVLVVKN